MTTYLDKGVFTKRQYRGSATFADAQLSACVFESCQVICLDYNHRVRFKAIEASRCTMKNCTVRGAIFQECRAEHLRSSGTTRLLSCLYDRVTLSGRLDNLMLKPTWAPETADFDAQLAKEQSGVDWALDISGIESKELDIRGIPADLIRRDEETQALVRAEVVQAADWQSVAEGASRFGILLMLEQGEPSCVIVAPKRNKKMFAEVMKQIRALRKAGLAE
jgi:hypothetical protein